MQKNHPSYWYHTTETTGERAGERECNHGRRVSGNNWKTKHIINVISIPKQRKHLCFFPMCLHKLCYWYFKMSCCDIYLSFNLWKHIFCYLSVYDFNHKNMSWWVVLKYLQKFTIRFITCSMIHSQYYNILSNNIVMLKYSVFQIIVIL